MSAPHTETLTAFSINPGSLLARFAGSQAQGDNYFRSILEALPAALYITDTEGRITYYNEAAVALWGHRPELGTSSWCGSWKLYRLDGTPMRHDECPMAIAIREQRPVRGEEAVAERPDGSRVPFVPYPTLLYDSDGKFVGAINMLVDVGDRKRADEYAGRLAAIVESSDDAIVSKDLNGIITSWNAGAERLFGYTAEETIGKPVTMLMPPERYDEEPGILERIRRGEPIDHYETVRRRKDGSLVDVSLSISPVKNAQGHIVGASKIARDITQLRRTRERQELLLKEMKHRIKNTLATVQALAMQTLSGVSQAEFSAFSARLGALGSAHDLLTLDRWNESSLVDVVTAALAPFKEKSKQRIVVSDGGDALLDSTKALLLAMALHELATNAVKYGALANGSGQVLLGWDIHSDAQSVRFWWEESGGRPVTPPTRKGFGSTLIERSLRNARFGFYPKGLHCTWEMPL
jgi:PAS domain S-box-containing protein